MEPFSSVWHRLRFFFFWGGRDGGKRGGWSHFPAELEGRVGPVWTDSGTKGEKKRERGRSVASRRRSQPTGSFRTPHIAHILSAKRTMTSDDLKEGSSRRLLLVLLCKLFVSRVSETANDLTSKEVTKRLQVYWIFQSLINEKLLCKRTKGLGSTCLENNKTQVHKKKKCWNRF